MFNLSSAQGARFAEIVTEMADRVKRLGPSPIKPGAEALETGMNEMTREAEKRIVAAQRAGQTCDCDGSCSDAVAVGARR